MEATTADHGHGKRYTFFVDDKEFSTESASMLVGQLMDLAGIPHGTQLVLIEEDGTQVQVAENETITFEGPGRRFKKAPRFKRG